MKYFYLKIFSLTIFSLSFCALKSNKDKLTVQNNSANKAKLNDELNWPWRGITIVSQSDREIVTEKSIKELAAYGVNLIRLRVSFRKFQEINKIDSEESWKNTINWCRKIISICSKNKISILISHSDFPLESNKKDDDHTKMFWSNQSELKNSISDVEKIVKTFDTIKGVIAYEFFSEPLINEPDKSYKPENWDSHFQQILLTVRRNSSKYLLYTPGPGGDPRGYLNMNKPIDDSKIIYNFHYYLPHKYTHQGIDDRNAQISYPFKNGKEKWNKTKMEKTINIVSNWKNKHHIKYVFAGEFSAVRWADNNDKYLNDLLTILELKKIGWAYFSFNGWKGWNYHFDYVKGSDRKTELLVKSTNKTSTLNLLIKYWKLNN